MNSAVADLLFQAKILKDIPRSGFHFLGAGRESVAEHTFCTAFIAFVMSRMEPAADAYRLLAMCLAHDLIEARTGDLNTVHKSYLNADEDKALRDTVRDLFFAEELAGLIEEFEANQSREAKLARDADQLALILDLKALSDVGHRPADKWLPPVRQRLQTETGRKLAEEILQTAFDRWWLKNTLDR